MKISVIYNDRFPSRIAHGVYLAKLCSSLSEAGADVELIVPKRFSEVPGDPFVFYNIKNRFKITKIWSFDFLIFAKYQPRLFYWLQYLNFYLLLFFYVLFRSRSRVIYTMDYLGPTLKILGYKVVFESHGGLEGGASTFLPLVLRSDLIVSTNPFIAKKFTDAGYPKEETLVAPNGVDIDNFEKEFSPDNFRDHLGLPKDKKIIAYVGKLKTMGKGKGVLELVEAFSKIIISNPNTHLMIVGISEDEQRELIEIIKSYGIPGSDYSLFLQVTQSEIADYMRASDILVMNYPKKEHYEYFMSPMKMFEYMASGKPIVSTDLASVREILNINNAVLVESDSVDSLTAGILKILNYPTMADRISKQAHKDVQQYTWNKRARKILDFIRSKI
jgi:glycosyltransferase involved in cell wall biosynthesis